MDKDNNAQIAEENKKICADLFKIGIKVKSVYDLLDYQESYSSAYPILASWLPKVTTLSIKEGIVRSFTIKKLDNEFVEVLFKEFNETTVDNKESLRWAIGNAIYEISRTDEYYSQIVEIIQNKNLGRSRKMFVLALGRSKKEETLRILLELLNDQDLLPYAIIALGNFGDKSVIDQIEKLITHPKSLVRNNAKQAIKKLRK